MVPVTRSLEAIATGHFVFEKDQVLTHDQLNSVSQYADDQIRLTRVCLLGVGIVCGLRVSLDGNTVRLSRGLGVTSDGDLLYVDQDTVYDRFKPYDESFPAYPPLYVNGDVEGDMIPAFELVAREADDARAQPLSRFAADNRALDRMTALLLMESYIRDDDLCSGTDCDNLGREAVHTRKLLLVDRNDAGSLAGAYATPAEAVRKLAVLSADRPVLPVTLNSPAALGAIYRGACNSIHSRLVAELPRLAEVCAPFLGDAIDAATTTRWVARLNAIRSSFANTTVNIQYYYDFLKDVVATCNEFRQQLANDAIVCVPDPNVFPKHLLLGDLAPGANPQANRTGYYPSPVVAKGEHLAHARFLLRRLGEMIERFRVANATAVRITPSAFEDRVLSDRAIPFYYDPAIHPQWCYWRTRQGLETQIYSYNANTYDTTGLASNPLIAQIAEYPFFRIEGHVGRNVTTVMGELEREIAARNLPFGVRAVLVGTERGHVVIKRPPRFSGLKDLHYILRQDAVLRLNQVEKFSGSFQTKVNTAVASGTVTDRPEDNDGVAVRQAAAENSTAVITTARTAKEKLNRSYAQYRADNTWQNDLLETMRNAGTFKTTLSPVVKTEFITPYDNLIAAPHLEWLSWIDQLINRKEEKQDERLLFSKFAAEHPELEHTGGVLRGGTFVLLYDQNSIVVGDAMLPYYCCEEQEEEDEPPLTIPTRPDVLIDSGIRIIPSRTTFIGRKFLDFEPVLNQKFELQKKSFQDAFDIVRGVTDLKGQVTGGFTDQYLGMLVEEQRIRQQRLDFLKQEAQAESLPADRRTFLENEINIAEQDLAGSIRKTTEYISATNKDVTVGSEGMTAMLEVSAGMSKIERQNVLDSTRTQLNQVMQGTQNTGLRVVLGGMIGR